jgi:hypothetical protein
VNAGAESCAGPEITPGAKIVGAFADKGSALPIVNAMRLIARRESRVSGKFIVFLQFL